MAVSNKVAFVNPNAPVYPRLAQGKVWNEVSSISVLIFISKLLLSRIWMTGSSICLCRELQRRKILLLYPYFFLLHSYSFVHKLLHYVFILIFFSGEWGVAYNISRKKCMMFTWSSDDCNMDKWIWNCTLESVTSHILS